MIVLYRVYANDGRGGPVDYGNPLATTPGPTFETAPLASPGDHTFAVRAFDPASGLEESNTEARARIVLDEAGVNVTGRPNSPHALAARATAGGGCWVSWAYTPDGRAAPPDGYHIYLTPGNVADRSVPAATVPHAPDQLGQACDLAGLADAQPYVVSVRAFRGAHVEVNVQSVSVVGRSNGSANVDGITAVASASR